MTLSWPDVDSLGLLPSDVCLFDVLSQPPKVPPPILPIKIPCKNDLREISMTAATISLGFFNKESYDRIRSLLVFSSEFSTL